ncbi:MAG: UDP-N-acetylglucosamine 2-epimerase (non-hydrolyzing) [Cyanobacteria bacterium]|nr:UDP-N-acetylglucosamine 2-epimerase (non-hydrolyzing) [Cyanobacteriota bacterium]
MKAAPVIAAVETAGVPQRLIHTGQHYDSVMSDLFFNQLGLPKPDIHLGVGSGSHAHQTAAVLAGVEKALIDQPPGILVVYGDVNSTMAATLAAVKMQIPVAHVEAGLRSFDRTMPEEINRIVTDSLASLLFTPSADGDQNLHREGVMGKVHRVGNVMIDTLVRILPAADATGVLSRAGIERSQPYVLVTLHRPATVDSSDVLEGVIEALASIAVDYPVIFPVHPRTRARLNPRWLSSRGLHLIEPLGYLEFLALERDARLVITDSGGVQEETTYLGVPCVTVRTTTERPVTITNGSNVLVGLDPAKMLSAARERLEKPPPKSLPPELWDGRASTRIAAVLLDAFGSRRAT